MNSNKFYKLVFVLFGTLVAGFLGTMFTVFTTTYYQRKYLDNPKPVLLFAGFLLFCLHVFMASKTITPCLMWGMGFHKQDEEKTKPSSDETQKSTDDPKKKTPSNGKEEIKVYQEEIKKMREDISKLIREMKERLENTKTMERIMYRKLNSDAQEGGVPSNEFMKKIEDYSKTICCICFDQSVNTIMIPCRHMHTCWECSLKCDHCPLCRKIIQQRFKPFM